MAKRLEQTERRNVLNENFKHESYDYKHQAVSLIREETILNCRPPKNSLSEIVFENRTEDLRKVLSSGALDADAIDSTGSTYSWTPLYWSVKFRRAECTEMLLEHGVNIHAVVNDCDECCGTVLDLVTLREDYEFETILRKHAEKTEMNFGQAFKAIRTKLRGKSQSFNFRHYPKIRKEDAA